MLESLSVKLSKYLSPQVYASIFAGSRDVELATERKRLTVFFSDIKDFTATTADMQPEDLTAMLNRYFTAMSKIALAHGAHIDKFIGDAMLMFFGDPETKGAEEDARACVRMAVAMQRQMVELQQEWRGSGFEQPFEMRVGINTGYCNVGNFGSDDRMDYTIIGAEVNLAARIEAAADPGAGARHRARRGTRQHRRQGHPARGPRFRGGWHSRRSRSRTRRPRVTGRLSLSGAPFGSRRRPFQITSVIDSAAGVNVHRRGMKSVQL